MQTLQTILFVVQVLVAAGLIGFILLQQGKGADAGAAFGSGASSTVFGSRGSGNFLTRTTSVLAFLFLANSLFLGYLASKQVKTQASLMTATEQMLPGSVINEPAQAPAIPEEIPAVPEPTGSDVPELPPE